MHRVQLGQFISKYFERVRLPAKKNVPRPWAYRFGPIEEARARFCEVQDIDITWAVRS